MEINVTPVRSKKQKRLFIRLPYRLYRDHPYWVAPLLIEQKKTFDTQRHPFFKHADAELFLAERDGEIVGRIVAMEDHAYEQCHGKKMGYFGFFECDLANGPEISQAVTQSLLDAARNWFTARGVTKMIGPMNPSTNYECGMIIENFERPPVIMMPYNPPEYPALMENAGLHKAHDLICYEYDSETLPDKVARVANICRRQGYTIRPVEMKKLDEEVEAIYRMYNAAWEKNWGFAPVSYEEFREMGRQMKQIAIPDLILIVEYKGEIAGFSLSLPDINEVLHKMNGRLLPFGIFKLMFGLKHIKTARVLVLGVMREHRRKGVDALLAQVSRQNAAKHGVTRGDFSWILESNEVVNNQMLAYGSQPYRKYRIYGDEFAASEKKEAEL